MFPKKLFAKGTLITAQIFILKTQLLHKWEIVQFYITLHATIQIKIYKSSKSQKTLHSCQILA